MLSVCAYLMFIGLLIWWVEGPSYGLTNSLIIRKNPAEELEAWLKRFSWKGSSVNVQAQLPRYKFYTEVVEILLSLARKIGGSYQDSVLFLREGLQADRLSEKKLREMLRGLWLQMLLMMALTWGFITSALVLTEMRIATWKLLLILLWQVLGLSVLPFVLQYLRRKYFADIGRLWKILYVLLSLAHVPLSRSEVFTIAGVSDLKNIRQKTLDGLTEKLSALCQRALQVGGGYGDEVRSLMDELRFLERWHFELFEKRLVVLKLLLLAVFFLPSYLAFIFILLGDLMAVM
jgi:hypothetical protein